MKTTNFVLAVLLFTVASLFGCATTQTAAIEKPAVVVETAMATEECPDRAMVTGCLTYNPDNPAECARYDKYLGCEQNLLAAEVAAQHRLDGPFVKTAIAREIAGLLRDGQYKEAARLSTEWGIAGFRALHSEFWGMSEWKGSVWTGEVMEELNPPMPERYKEALDGCRAENPEDEKGRSMCYTFLLDFRQGTYYQVAEMVISRLHPDSVSIVAPLKSGDWVGRLVAAEYQELEVEGNRTDMEELVRVFKPNTVVRGDVGTEAQVIKTTSVHPPLTLVLGGGVDDDPKFILLRTGERAMFNVTGPGQLDVEFRALRTQKSMRLVVRRGDRIVGSVAIPGVKGEAAVLFRAKGDQHTAPGGSGVSWMEQLDTGDAQQYAMALIIPAESREDFGAVGMKITFTPDPPQTNNNGTSAITSP